MRALDIRQRWRADMSAAVMSAAVRRGGWAVCLRPVAPPCHPVTEQASPVVATARALRPGFDGLHCGLQLRRAAGHVPLADAAVLPDHGLRSDHSIRRILSGGRRILPPFRSQIALRRQGGLWRAATITASINTSRWPVGLPAEADLTGPAPGEEPE